jgi:FixJ family two-component response regulator
VLNRWSTAAASQTPAKATQMHRSRNPEPVGHIALVDDDASVRRALARVLSAHFRSVRTYPSGMEFLKSLENGAPDCLMLDLNMPDMTGLQVLHHLAAGGCSIPVVILTAQDELGIQSRCQLAGATAFLTKPVTTEALVRVLTSAMATNILDMAVSQFDDA